MNHPEERASSPPRGPGDLGEIATSRRVLTARQLEECTRLRDEIEERLGLRYTLGQLILERVFSTNPKARRMLLRVGGVEEVFGTGVSVDFWKLSRSAHERFMDRVEHLGLLTPESHMASALLCEELGRMGVKKRLGEILVDRGLVPRSLAEEHRGLAVSQEELPAFAFCRIAVQNGLVSEEEVADVAELADEIEEDLGIRLPIGWLFHRKGLLRHGEVEAILATQVQIGRLANHESHCRALELTELEQDALLLRLRRDGLLGEDALVRATEITARLATYGLEVDALELLWVLGGIPEEAVRDVEDHRAACRARYDPSPPKIALSPAASAEVFCSERPPDIAEVDFLFGQFAIVTGAITRSELEECVHAFRIARGELGLSTRLSRILYDRHRDEAPRLAKLRVAEREVSEFLGYGYEVRSVHLSPLENDLAEVRLEAEHGVPQGEIEAAWRAVERLLRLGVRRTVPELLLEKGVLTGPAWEGFQYESRCKSPGSAQGEERSKTQKLFERAFSSESAAPGWGRSQLGDLAIEGGLVSPRKVVHALYVQMRARELGVLKPLGEVLVELRYLTKVELEGLLALQAKRLCQIKEESLAEADPLAPFDQLLLGRIQATGILDPEKLRMVLLVRSQMRSLGLAGGLEEVLVRRGELDPDIVRALVTEVQREEETRRLARKSELQLERARAGTSAEELQESYRQALEEVQKGDSRRSPPVAARAASGRGRLALVAAALAAVLLAGTWLLSLSPDESPRDRVSSRVKTRSRAVEAAAADEGAFEEAMAQRGMTKRDGRWVGAKEAQRSDPVSTSDTREAREARYRRSQEDRGFERTEEGWSSPEALRRLEALGNRSSEGKILIGGRWRPAATAFELAAQPEKTASSPALSDLVIHILVEETRTRIGLRVRSVLAPGATLVLIAARCGSNGAPASSTRVALPSRGEIELEATPIDHPLESGVYGVELVYRPEFQSAPVALENPDAVVCHTEVLVGGGKTSDSFAPGGHEALTGALVRMERLASLLLEEGRGEEEDVGSSRTSPMESYVEAQALHTVVVTEALRSGPEGHADLLEAARLLCEGLARDPPRDERILQELRGALERARNQLFVSVPLDLGSTTD